MNASGLRLRHKVFQGLDIKLWDLSTLLIIFNGHLYHYAYVSVYLHETCEKDRDKSLS